MVTLVDDHLPVVGDEIGYDALLVEGLDHSDIDGSSRPDAASADCSDRGERHFEEGRKPLSPLVQKLAAMYEHQCVDLAGGDEPGADHGLAERRGCAQYTGVVRQDRLRCLDLLRRQLAVERHIERLSICSLVTEPRRDAVRLEQLERCF
jgi:hypothetical protein